MSAIVTAADDTLAGMQIVVLAGGVGGSTFVRGVRAAYPDATITVVGNTADDITLHGLRICPDLDTMMYTLGGGIDAERRWGRADESWRLLEELRAYGAEDTWFSLGDRDLATHVARSALLRQGWPLSAVTRRLAARWLAGDDRLHLLPMSDDPVETQVTIADPHRREIHFQEYWVRRHAEPDALAVRWSGAETATPAPGVVEAIADAALVLVAPSNPVVSIGPILAVPGIRDAVRAASAPVVGFSGILGGAPVLGMAHRLLPAIGVAVAAASVGVHYGARSGDGVLDVWAMDRRDADGVAEVGAAGLRTVVTELLMHDDAATADFIHTAVAVAAAA